MYPTTCLPADYFALSIWPQSTGLHDCKAVGKVMTVWGPGTSSNNRHSPRTYWTQHYTRKRWRRFIIDWVVAQSENTLSQPKTLSRHVHRLRQPYRACLVDCRTSAKRVFWHPVFLSCNHLSLSLDSATSQHTPLLRCHPSLVHQAANVAQIRLAYIRIASSGDDRVCCVGSVEEGKKAEEGNARRGGT